MHVLHTADVHLHADRPATLEALEAVLAVARERDVDLVTVGGDLFDSPDDAEALRPELRDLLDDNPFDVLAIPGNHDERVYRRTLHFGNDLEVLTDEPFASVAVDDDTLGDVEVVGVPFQASMTEELYAALAAHRTTDRTQILLLHCTLDLGFHASAVGEGEGTYFPVTAATLADLGYDYVLAGHIHSSVRRVRLDGGGTFVYPGSPVSHAKSETGRRHAVALDTGAGRVSTVELDTFYHDSLTRLVRPGGEDDLLSELAAWVGERAGDSCELAVTVEGFVDRDEDVFADQLAEAATPVEPTNRTRSVSQVLEHPLYRRFVERLDDRAPLDGAGENGGGAGAGDDAAGGADASDVHDGGAGDGDAGPPPVDRDQVEARVLSVLSHLLARNEVRST